MSKITITNEHNESIVGILEEKHTPLPRLALIVHGVLGHKDYLFQRLLAQELPISSFRFDLRGNGESTGSPGFANMLEDTEDIHTVAAYFEAKGYEIYAVIGHSRGAIASFKYAATCEKPVPIMVNISGRFKMNDNQLNTSRPEIGQALKEHGYFDWHVKQRDRIVTIKVTQQEVDKFYNWSNEHVSRIPLSTCVLTCHGLKDNIVPPYNAAMFANRVPNHTLTLIPEADHNFKGRFEIVTKEVVDFVTQHQLNHYQKAIRMGQQAGLVIPRWIDIEGVRNFRDIGGWPVQNGSGYIRERIVFRSGNLAKITDQGRLRLRMLNVKAVFDFRLDHEVERDGFLTNTPEIVRIECNLYKEVVKTNEEYFRQLKVFLDGEKGFAEGYKVILDSGKKLIGEVFRYMIKELSIYHRSSIIIHCTAGKDRTGVFVMLLLGLCGVDDEIIAREYEMTNLGYFDFEKDLDKRSRQLGVSVENLRAALSASYGGMKLAIQQLKETYGSFEAYVIQQCGLSQIEVEAIRQLMIVPIRFEERQLYRPKF